MDFPGRDQLVFRLLLAALAALILHSGEWVTLSVFLLCCPVLDWLRRQGQLRDSPGPPPESTPAEMGAPRRRTPKCE